MKTIWFNIVKYFEWLNHQDEDHLDILTSGLNGYWKSDKRKARCEKYGWE